MCNLTGAALGAALAVRCHFFEFQELGGARCRLAHFQDWGSGEVHDVSTHVVRVGRDGHCTWIPIHLGGRLTLRAYGSFDWISFGANVAPPAVAGRPLSRPCCGDETRSARSCRAKDTRSSSPRRSDLKRRTSLAASAANHTIVGLKLDAVGQLPRLRLVTINF